MRVIDLRKLPIDPEPVLVRAVELELPCGFPSPSQDYQTQEIDLNEVLMPNRTSCYIGRVSGHSMTPAGIFDGDEIIIDRSIRPLDGHVVVATLDGERTVKRLRRTSTGGAVLSPDNPDYPPIEIPEHSELVIWGVVTRCLHSVGRA